MVVKEPASVYACQIYSDQSGQLVAKGRYVFASCDAERRCTPRTTLTATPGYEAYDGITIHLGHDALLPDGEIDYPFGDRHGERRTYVLGVEKGPGSAY